MLGTLLALLLPALLAAQACPSGGRSAVTASRVVVAADAAAALVTSVADWRDSGPAHGWRWFPSRDVRAQLGDVTAPLHVVGSFRLADGMRRLLEAQCMPTAEAWRWALAYGAAVGVAKEVVDGWYGGATPADLALNGVGLGLAVLHARSTASQAVLPVIGLDPGALRDGRGSGALSGWLTVTPGRLSTDGDRARGVLSMLRLGFGRRLAADGREQWLVGLDLDVAGLPLEGEGWRAALSVLRHVRLPGPALVIDDAGVRGVLVAW